MSSREILLRVSIISHHSSYYVCRVWHEEVTLFDQGLYMGNMQIQKRSVWNWLSLRPNQSVLRLWDVTSNLLPPSPLLIFYRLRQLIMVAPKSHQPLDSILNGSPNPSHQWSQFHLKNHFFPSLSWKAIQWLTWLAWSLWSLLARLFGLTSLVSLPQSFIVPA